MALFHSFFLYGCAGSSLLCTGFLQLQWVGATLHWSARASLAAEHRLHACRLQMLQHIGFRSCGIQAELLQGIWALPGSGIEPVPPTLAGGFSSIVSTDNFSFFLSFFLFNSAAPGLTCSTWTLICGTWDLVPWQGIKPRPLALGMWSLSQWANQGSPYFILFYG